MVLPVAPIGPDLGVKRIWLQSGLALGRIWRESDLALT